MSTKELLEMRDIFSRNINTGDGNNIPPTPPRKRKDDRPQKPKIVILVGINVNDFVNKDCSYCCLHFANSLEREGSFLDEKMKKLAPLLASLDVVKKGSFRTRGACFYEVSLSAMTPENVKLIKENGYRIGKTFKYQWQFSRNDLN